MGGLGDGLTHAPARAHSRTRTYTPHSRQSAPDGQKACFTAVSDLWAGGVALDAAGGAAGLPGGVAGPFGDGTSPVPGRPVGSACAPGGARSLPVPGRRFYSPDWAQLENGVGLVRKFLEHSRRFLRRRGKGADEHHEQQRRAS